MKYITEEDNSSKIANLPALFIRAWILMLILGGLGHILKLPYLYKFDYWVCLLIILAYNMLRGVGVIKWVTKEKY